MTNLRLLPVVASIGVASLVMAGCARDSATSPPMQSSAAAGSTTAPTTAPSTALGITPEARDAISKLSDAYEKLATLDLSGRISTDLDAGGEKQKTNPAFASSFEAPNKFRHETDSDVMVGLTGQKAYAYVKSQNAFMSSDAPAQRVATKALPQPLPRILSMQNPSLMLALASDPGSELTSEAAQIVVWPDTVIEGGSYQTLNITLRNKANIVLLIDPATHLLRQARTDYRAMFQQQGMTNVKSALFIVDYTVVKPGGPVTRDQFAWEPPAGARDLAENTEERAALALEGHPAPDFSLQGVDGKAVARSDLKGQVYILDFWATWCGPCMMSLPRLNKLYEGKKSSGLKVYAVNVREDKATVQKFIGRSKLTIPVLLDPTGQATETFKAMAIPETVLVGKNGNVKKIFIGVEPTTETDMAAAVDAALKE